MFFQEWVHHGVNIFYKLYFWGTRGFHFRCLGHPWGHWDACCAKGCVFIRFSARFGVSVGGTFGDLGATFRAKAPQWSHGARCRGRLFWQRVFCWWRSIVFDKTELNGKCSMCIWISLAWSTSTSAFSGSASANTTKSHPRGSILGSFLEGLGHVSVPQTDFSGK
jgi:hypothetical protein